MSLTDDFLVDTSKKSENKNKINSEENRLVLIRFIADSPGPNWSLDTLLTRVSCCVSDGMPPEVY